MKQSPNHSYINKNYPKATREKPSPSDKKYQTLFESIDEGFCVIKVLFNEDKKPFDFRFLEVNPAFEKQTGFTDAVGKTMRELEPAHEDYWFTIYGKVAVTGKPIRFEKPAKAMGRYYNVYAFPFDEPGKHKVAVLFNDVTERKKNEYNNAWLGAIIESSVDAIISKNLNGVITSWNTSAERVFGYTAKEAVGNNISMLIPKDRLNEETEILDRLRKGDSIEQFETIRKRKDGTTIDVSLTISPIKDPRGNIVGAAKIARDISKRKEAEQKLKRLNETLEERVDQRTEQLSSYQNKLRILASGLNEAEEQHRNSLATELHNNIGQMLAVANLKISYLQSLDLTENTKEEIEELSQLIHDALSYTRELMSDLQPPPSLKKEDFIEVLDWLAQKMEKYDLKVTIKDDGRSKPIEQNVRLTLQQSVQELLFNVVKHAQTDIVNIYCTREDEDTVQIIVDDEGKGFNISDTPPVPTHEGGFGLFNIYERMDFLGGSLKIVSHPGDGTEAILQAPLKKDKIDESPEEKHLTSIHPKSSKQKKKKNILDEIRVMLVDDHEMVRKGLRKMVEEEDQISIIAEASNGEEAIEMASNIVPDIIIMDVDLPRMNGIEATKKISSISPEIPIIGLSLHDNEKLREDMIKAGAFAYLTKAEGFETLCSIIKDKAGKTSKKGKR